MLTFDSVKLRLEREQPLTFLEFNYMILQAYDFLRAVAARTAAGCRWAGRDQWGNIVNGIELTRRIDGTEVFGVTTPLITTADGAKMGKTAQGAVWLNEEQLQPLRLLAVLAEHATTRDVGRFLRLFTDLPLDEIARLESARGRGDQRGQDRARQRSDGDAARPRGGRGGGARPRARPSTAAAPATTCRRLSVGEGMISIVARADRARLHRLEQARRSARSPKARCG